MITKELLDMLNILKGQARELGDDTKIMQVKQNSFNFVINEAIKVISQENCDDVISREEVLKLLDDLEKEDIDTYGCLIPEGFHAAPAKQRVLELKSKKPTHKVGTWEKSNTALWMCKCSNCGELYRKSFVYGFKFCPNCGARMVSE